MAQITFTDDAIAPKVITFGDSPLVKWFAYIRSSADNNIYLRRSVDGVVDPEVLTVSANPPAFGATQSGVDYFNFIQDPADSTKAHLYFLSDGTLFRITVTSTPVGEQPSAQQFDRVNNRADTIVTKVGAGAPLAATANFGAIPAPTVALLRSETPGNRTLVITPRNGPTERYFPLFVEVYRAQNEAGSVLFDTLFVGAIPTGTHIQFAIENPEAAGGNTELWHVRALNSVYNTRSNFAHVYDDGTDPFAEGTNAQAIGSVGASLIPATTKISRLPVKVTRSDATSAQALGGAGGSLTPATTKVVYVPDKYIRAEPDEPAEGVGGVGASLIPIVTKQRVV